jgi:hypothetical protein
MINNLYLFNGLFMSYSYLHIFIQIIGHLGLVKGHTVHYYISDLCFTNPTDKIVHTREFGASQTLEMY